ncbi:hypothetical protein Goshw_005571 [Gossypium schwendimanii]|uniref:Uncharacterized protein n=1 Tax=Gossypium schwendimanii TaxID=34291 RepID=A0A7J9L802_GOSSC|nr:hypothetical protein [Gossypium schwendimanii]
MEDKLHRREGNNPDHQLRPLNDHSVINKVGVQRQPEGLPRSSHSRKSSSTEGESEPKIRPKDVVNREQPKDGYRFKDTICPYFFKVRRGRENSSSQCSSIRCYGVEVTLVILLEKVQTIFNKRVPIPETDTGG